MIFATPKPRWLPAVQVNGVRYVVDMRCRLLRQIDAPQCVVYFERRGCFVEDE